MESARKKPFGGSPMKRDSQFLVLEPIKADPVPGADSDSRRMRVTVVFTTIAGTVAALESAARLARNLNAEIVLLVAEVIYFRYALEHPPVAPSFFENLCLALVDELDTELSAASIEIRFCRDQLHCLQQALSPRSLVVLGARRRWWNTHEHRLQRALERHGHSVLLVQASQNSRKLHTKSVTRRMLSYATAQS